MTPAWTISEYLVAASVSRGGGLKPVTVTGVANAHGWHVLWRDASPRGRLRWSSLSTRDDAIAEVARVLGVALGEPMTPSGTGTAAGP